MTTFTNEKAAVTDWPALLLAALVPGVVACGFVDAALVPEWEESGDWALGLGALFPLELVRALAFYFLGEAYQEYQNPQHAVHAFLISILAMCIVFFAIALGALGIGGLFATLRDLYTLAVVAIPVAVVVADGVIGLYFFRGNARRQGARIEAAAADISDLLQLTLVAAPILFVVAAMVLIWLEKSGHRLRGWNAEDGNFGALRPLCMFYVAGYFALKAWILAHVHTARFNNSGHRLLNARWIQNFINKHETRAAEAQKEAANEREQKAALQS